MYLIPELEKARRKGMEEGAKAEREAILELVLEIRKHNYKIYAPWRSVNDLLRRGDIVDAIDERGKAGGRREASEAQRG